MWFYLKSFISFLFFFTALRLSRSLLASLNAIRIQSVTLVCLFLHLYFQECIKNATFNTFDQRLTVTVPKQGYYEREPLGRRFPLATLELVAGWEQGRWCLGMTPMNTGQHILSWQKEAEPSQTVALGCTSWCPWPRRVSHRATHGHTGGISTLLPLCC